ncbi:MAG: hypothetical protein RL266_1408 [Bacteroidota bacterium]
MIDMSRISVIILLISVAFSSSAQLIVDPSYTAQELVDVIVADGITVSNVVLNCPTNGSAYFDGTGSNINMATGVLLTSGTVFNAAMNNNDPGVSACNGAPGDPQVEAVANETTYDACILEFDMVPTCSQLNFTFVFGSDEYPEYINREFADAMVITISGPGFVGQENIALIPNTNEGVGIATLNSNEYGQYYVNNGGGATIQYDGFTVPLTATANVTICEQYHIKLAVADAADCIFDSGVFFAENSLDCGISNSVTTQASVGLFQPIEGCRTYEIELCREGDLSVPYDLNLSYDGTATNGVDYAQLPNVLTFPAGTACQILTIEAYDDGLFEGAETIEFVYEAISGICLVYDTIEIQIIDDQNLSPEFFYNDVCDGSTVFFSNSTSITPPATATDFVWKFGDGTELSQYNASYLYPVAGDYDVWLVATSNDNCVDSVMHTVHVYGYPSSNFTFSDVCLGNAANFTNQSLPPVNDNIGDVLWNFGDGGSANSWDAFHYYSIPDTFPVSLTVYTEQLNCAHAFSDTIIVYPPITTDFVTNDVCFGDTVNFINESVGNANWEWNFDDGSPFSSAFDTAHLYNSPGEYDVRLVGISPNGCNDTTILQVTVYDAPIASFSTMDICENELAQFTNTTTLPSFGGLGSWYWTFSDNTNSSGYSPLHLFPDPGQYTATLIVYNEVLGCSDTMTQSLTSYAVPEAQFSVGNVCHNVTVVPTNLSLNTASSWTWNFGDGTPDIIDPNPFHLYDQPGSYTVTMVATYNDQCSDTTEAEVTIYELPTATFDWNYVCEGSPTTFLNQSSVPFPENIIGWIWNYGDGSALDPTVNGEHVYADGGNYNVSLQVTTGHGCEGDTSGTIWVNYTPNASVSVSDPSGCPVHCIDFVDNSGIPFGEIIDRKWNFGDFQFGDSTFETHCYTNDDFFESSYYNIRYDVESDSGCVSTLMLDSLIQIYPITYANFDWTPDSVSTFDPHVQFVDRSYGASIWTWDLGDTNQYSTSFDQNPEFDYSGHGFYDIQLIADNQYGCADTTLRTIYIYADIRFYVPTAFTPNNDGINDLFSGYGSDIDKYNMQVFNRWGGLIFESNDIDYAWDGTVNGHPAKVGVYIYSFTITDFNGNPKDYTGQFSLLR